MLSYLALEVQIYGQGTEKQDSAAGWKISAGRYCEHPEGKKGQASRSGAGNCAGVGDLGAGCGPGDSAG